MIMKKLIHPLVILGLGATLTGCGLTDYVESVSAKYNALENQTHALGVLTHEQEAEIHRLMSEVKELKAQNAYLRSQLGQGERRIGREIASLRSFLPPGDVDEVRFESNHWTPDQMHAVAVDEFHKKNYARSAQFFMAMKKHYPEHPKVKTDEFLFHAGVAAYESGKYGEWVDVHLGELMSTHPTSRYYRGAKLWTGLNELRKGNHAQFFAVYEEFRKNYRNTEEWKILSAHHEQINKKFRP
jgi:hypothetical protein